MGSKVSAITWDASLETGIDVLDEQHHRYIDLVNDYLYEVGKSSAGSTKLLELAEKFNFLRQYAGEHFATEEAVMIKSGYPGYELHKEEHSFFLRHVEELYISLRAAGYNPDIEREVNYYTVEWFVQHIQISDMKLVEFIKQKSTKDEKLPIFLRRIHQSLFRRKPADS